MFEIGFWELVLVAVIALIVAGPERLPGIARTLGRWAGRSKATVNAIRTEFERELDTADDKRDNADSQQDKKS